MESVYDQEAGKHLTTSKAAPRLVWNWETNQDEQNFDGERPHDKLKWEKLRVEKKSRTYKVDARKRGHTKVEKEKAWKR